MLNLDNLIKKSTDISCFNDLITEYENNIKSLNELEKELKMLEIKKDRGLSLKEADDICWILDLARTMNINVDTGSLKNKLICEIPGLYKYKNTLILKENLEERNSELLRNYVDFSKFEYNNCEHNFITYNGNLLCAKCLASTKYYNVTKKEIDFLELCAKKQGKYLINIRRKDLPLYNLLLQEHYEMINNMDENSSDYSESKCMAEESVLNDICRKIKIANMMDKKEYKIDEYRTIKPEYLSYETGERLLNEIEEIREQIFNSDSKHKYLLLEMCNVVMYEILILRGQSINELLNNVETDIGLTALAKAYYNLSNPERRIKSKYFENEKDAILYECLTANPKINQKILDMKLKR